MRKLEAPGACKHLWSQRTSEISTWALTWMKEAPIQAVRRLISSMEKRVPGVSLLINVELILSFLLGICKISRQKYNTFIL